MTVLSPVQQSLLPIRQMKLHAELPYLSSFKKTMLSLSTCREAPEGSSREYHATQKNYQKISRLVKNAIRAGRMKSTLMDDWVSFFYFNQKNQNNLF
jgi:hypothetical protein